MAAYTSTHDGYDDGRDRLGRSPNSFWLQQGTQNPPRDNAHNSPSTNMNLAISDPKSIVSVSTTKKKSAEERAVHKAALKPASNHRSYRRPLANGMMTPDPPTPSPMLSPYPFGSHSSLAVNYLTPNQLVMRISSDIKNRTADEIRGHAFAVEEESLATATKTAEMISQVFDKSATTIKEVMHEAALSAKSGKYKALGKFGNQVFGQEDMFQEHAMGPNAGVADRSDIVTPRKLNMPMPLYEYVDC